MKNLKDFLASYKQIWFEKPWYGLSLKKLLERIDDSLVHQKLSGVPTISDQAQHMIAWQQYMINKIEGNLRNIGPALWKSHGVKPKRNFIKM